VKKVNDEKLQEIVQNRTETSDTPIARLHDPEETFAVTDKILDPAFSKDKKLLLSQSADQHTTSTTAYVPAASYTSRTELSRTGEPIASESTPLLMIGNQKEVTDIKLDELLMPWDILALTIDPDLAPYLYANALIFGVLYTTFLMLTLELGARDNFNFNSIYIGLCYLPAGVALIFGSVIGGTLSDLSGKDNPESLDGRMLYPIALAGIASVVGSIGFGFSFLDSGNLVPALIFLAVLGLSQAVLLPATMSYITLIVQDNIASAVAAQIFLAATFAAIWTSIAVLIESRIGVQYLFLILGFCLLLVTGNAYLKCSAKIKQAQEQPPIIL
jgi:hypothetical protein